MNVREDEKCIQNFGWKPERNKDHLGNLGSDGKLVL